jgi:hypothetical protein
VARFSGCRSPADYLSRRRSLGNDNLAQELSAYDASGKDDDEQAKAGKEAERWAKKMAERGFSNALGAGLGGVFAERIERLALISLTDIASIYCFRPGDTADAVTPESAGERREPDRELTNAARRYLLALALLAENHPRSTGSYRLRSGCELLPVKKGLTILGAGNDSEHANALKQLCENRELLIAIASAAHGLLGIPREHPLFESDRGSLRTELQGGKTKPANGATATRRRGTKRAASPETPPATVEPGAEDQID